MIHSFDALIVGGGAAGLMCAIEAGKRGRRVAVLEHSERIGKKILISGGGRCNFTNIRCQPENFLSDNPHFAKSALSRYTPADFIALVEKHNIRYHEKALGQLFCDGSAREIVNMLEEECRMAGVTIFVRTTIKDVRRAERFELRTDHNEFRAPVLIVASGGLSIPKIGATSLGYDLARQFGLKIVEPRPGLVPLVFNSEDQSHLCDLAGVSSDVIASCDDAPQFREKMLITHRGLSGPAILQVSSYWKREGQIRIDLAPSAELTSEFHDAKKPRTTTVVRSELRKSMANRLADRWLELHSPASWSNASLNLLERDLHSWTVAPAGTEGFAKAEVTVGGVSTDELSAKNLETHKVPGLFFIGEVVDVTGHLGGFNFQWAWASGAAAGRAL